MLHKPLKLLGISLLILLSGISFAGTKEHNVYQGKITSVEWNFFSVDGKQYYDVTICLHNENTSQINCPTAFGYETGYMWRVSELLVNTAINLNKDLRLTTGIKKYWFAPNREIIEKLAIIN